MVFERVTNYVGSNPGASSSSSSLPAFLESERLAPLVDKIDVDNNKEHIFNEAVAALRKRRIFIPQQIAANLKTQQLEEERRFGFFGAVV